MQVNFGPIKKGSFVYSRKGKFKTSYLIKYRRAGIKISAPLDMDRADFPEDTNSDFNKRLEREANRVIEYKLSMIEGERQEEKQIEEKSSLVKFETLIKKLVESKSGEGNRKSAQWYLEKKVLPLLLEKGKPYVSDITATDLDDLPGWFTKKFPGEKFFNPRKYFRQVMVRARKLHLLHPSIEDLKIPNPDPETDAGKIYTEAEVEGLLEEASDVLSLQILMAYTMGMRKGEILKLKWSCLNWDRQTIRLESKATKIRRGREFRVNEVVWKLLKGRFLTLGSKTPYVFPVSNSRMGCKEAILNYLRPTLDNKSAWQACKRRAKVTGRFHDLRHTFLTNEVIRNKHQAMDVCFYAGLSIQELKRTYLHPTTDDTAYLADKKTAALYSMKSIARFLDNNLDNESERARYA